MDANHRLSEYFLQKEKQKNKIYCCVVSAYRQEQSKSKAPAHFFSYIDGRLRCYIHPLRSLMVVIIAARLTTIKAIGSAEYRERMDR